MRSSWFKHKSYWVSQEVQEVKNLPANAGDVGDLDSIPGLGRFPGEGNGSPLQYSCLGNRMDRGTWQATVQGGHKESDMTKRLTVSLSQVKGNSS